MKVTSFVPTQPNILEFQDTQKMDAFLAHKLGDQTKAAAPPGGQILQILMAQNLYFTKLYIIPEIIIHVGTFEMFGKMT